jgi:hypothetical protein
MKAAAISLAAAYALLAVLLLSLNLKSGWRWPVKAAAIAVTTAFFVVAFVALEAMLGWPTEAAPPARFRLHAALVHEPDRRAEHAGTIYLWLSPRNPEGEVTGPPRAYALPYSRELHEATAKAKNRMQDGHRVNGKTARKRSQPGRYGARGVRVELFEAPIARLPPKTSD